MAAAVAGSDAPRALRATVRAVSRVLSAFVAVSTADRGRDLVGVVARGLARPPPPRRYRRLDVAALVRRGGGRGAVSVERGDERRRARRSRRRGRRDPSFPRPRPGSGPRCRPRPARRSSAASYSAYAVSRSRRGSVDRGFGGLEARLRPRRAGSARRRSERIRRAADDGGDEHDGCRHGHRGSRHASRTAFPARAATQVSPGPEGRRWRAPGSRGRDRRSVTAFAAVAARARQRALLGPRGVGRRTGWRRVAGEQRPGEVRLAVRAAGSSSRGCSSMTGSSVTGLVRGS